MAGEIVTRLSAEHRAPIIPVDSEHSAIFQCLTGEHSAVEKVILTASGGPFLHRPAEELERVSVEEALNHPSWCMGAKVTIDSASLMNKGFEVIEARWLFGLRPEQIDVVIHPRSVIHSMVQFGDGAVKAQIGTPDMHLPIQYALTFPQRLPLQGPRIDFCKLGCLEFFRTRPDALPESRAGVRMPAARRQCRSRAERSERSGRSGIPRPENPLHRHRPDQRRDARPDDAARMRFAGRVPPHRSRSAANRPIDIINSKYSR